MPMQRYPSLYDGIKDDLGSIDAEGHFDDSLSDAEKREMVRRISDGTFPGNIWLGRDLDRTKAALRKYGWKGLGAIWHPKNYPID